MEPEIAKKLDRITLLLVSILLVVAVAGVCLVVGVIPKMERVVAASERIERRVHGMADSLDPLLSKSADKAKSLLEGKKDDPGSK